MKAKRWSFSALEQAENCLLQFQQVRVLKNYKTESDSEEAVWGRYVHKAFEDRQGTRTPLPQDLADHEPFMERLEGWEGFFYTEQQVALDKQLQPVHFFSKDVWWSGVIDYQKTDKGDNRTRIVDYKTGKRKPKPAQLIQNALWVFADKPEVNIVDCMFYWTQDAHLGPQKATDRYVYTRDQIPELWNMFIPALTRLKQAYNTDTWPAKPSGLCYGWCPHTTCTHWRPKRVK